jgi:nitrite reductase/ring-hydroxylating ferredoxin subunit
MSSDPPGDKGPDLTKGVATETLADGKMLAGHVGDEAVLLARRGDEYFAIGAECTHYHGPLVEGLMVGDTVRCPWHHACFSLRTGEAVRAPALDPVACWTTEVREGKVVVLGKAAAQQGTVAASAAAPQKIVIVIVGVGAAGFAAAEMLRRLHYPGSLVMLPNASS